MQKRNQTDSGQIDGSKSIDADATQVEADRQLTNLLRDNAVRIEKPGSHAEQQEMPGVGVREVLMLALIAPLLWLYSLAFGRTREEYEGL